MKSSFSAATNCVDVAFVNDQAVVTDTKDNGEGPALTFTADEWVSFINGAKDNQFDALNDKASVNAGV